MNTKAIMKEFMKVGYSGPGNRVDKLEDIVLGNYIIARITYSGIQVIWLGNGNRLSIPWEIIDLFSSLNTIYGEKILWEGYKEEADDIEKLIYLFVFLINQFNWSRGKSFLDALGMISEIGTHNLREWIEKEFNEKLPPLELVTLERTIQI